MDDREVRPLDRPSSQLGNKAFAASRCACHDHQARRPLVETLDDARALVLRAGGGYIGEKADELLHEGALGVPCAGVDHQAGGLVHDHQVFVGENDHSLQGR
jgi:hypothetical protein